MAKKFIQYQDMIAKLYPELSRQDNPEVTNEEKTLSRTVTFQVTDACNLACSYCVDGDTLIRMADYSLKPIKDIEIGDKVLGFDEYTEKQKQTKVHSSTVEQKFIHLDKLIEVEFDTGEKLKITKNHKVLVRRNSYMNNKNDFVPIGELDIGSDVYRLPILDTTYRFIKSISPALPRKSFERCVSVPSFTITTPISFLRSTFC